MLGLKLSDLVCGRMRWVFISNYMVDLQWLLSEAPDLANADRLMVAHGWRRPARYAVQENVMLRTASALQHDIH